MTEKEGLRPVILDSEVKKREEFNPPFKKKSNECPSDPTILDAFGARSAIVMIRRQLSQYQFQPPVV
jgi:hypothetical protein